MRTTAVFLVLFLRTIIGQQAWERSSLPSSASLSQQGAGIYNNVQLYSCCGSPICLPSDPCDGGFMLGAPLQSRQLNGSGVTVAGSAFWADISKANISAEGLYCCGGPTCLPNEPCGNRNSEIST